MPNKTTTKQTRKVVGPSPRSQPVGRSNRAVVDEALLSQVKNCLCWDQPRLLKSIRRGENSQAIVQAVERSMATLREREHNVPEITVPGELPVARKADALAQLIRQHQIVVVCGETGSGKSTQLPKLCLQAGLGIRGRIAHTQPRRIAARSVADRLSQELQSPLGKAVGYKVRFSEKTDYGNYIRVLTDGMLLAECEQDRFLNQYDAIIIDEAHERSLNIDFLLGIFKTLLKKRDDLKLIITSATLDSAKFSEHFDDAPVVNIEGRSFPVEVRYQDTENLADGSAAAVDLSDRVLLALLELQSIAPGDTLVFLPGEREIRECADFLKRRLSTEMDVLPLYARLSPSDQQRIFRTGHHTRVILATNVAETSLTVPGIRYVIDSGLARVSRYSPSRKIQRLPVEKISQSAASQRAGRCGRTADGVCVRLYSEDDFDSRQKYTDAEILRTSLADVILRMKSMGLGLPSEFPFVDSPERKQINDGLRELRELGALDEDDCLTRVGRRLSRLPVDPRIGRMLLAADRYGCMREMLIIAAALSVPDPRQVPSEHQQKARQIHKQLVSVESDFIGFLEIWRAFREVQQNQSKRKAWKWCEDNFLSVFRMREWASLQANLLTVLKQQKFRLNREPASHDAIHKALLTGLLSNIAVKQQASVEASRPKNGRKKRKLKLYEGTYGKSVQIFPASSCRDIDNKWIVSAELVETSALFARIVAPVKVEWIERAAEHLLHFSYSDPVWQPAQERVVARRRASLYGLSIYHGRRCDYGKVDAVDCRKIFIRRALIDHQLESRMPFMRHNLEAVEVVERLQNKLRRRDLMLDEEKLFEFYDELIPAHVLAASDLRKWHKSLPAKARDRLFLSVEALMNYPVDPEIANQYPDEIARNNISLPLEYAFEPGAQNDGVTARIKLPLLNQLSAEAFDRLVPGMLRDKLVAMVKSLPKDKRRAFVPIPDCVEAVMAGITQDTRPLPIALAATLEKVGSVAVCAGDFRMDRLEELHTMKLKLIDDQNKTLAISGDIADLKTAFGDRAHKSFVARGSNRIERDGIIRWTFEDIPETIAVTVGDYQTVAYPALVDYGESVSIEVFDTEEEALLAHSEGVRRLLLLSAPSLRKLLRKPLPDWQRTCLMYASIGSVEELQWQLFCKAQDRVFFHRSSPVRTRQDFEDMLNRKLSRVSVELTDLATIVHQTLINFRNAIDSLQNAESVLSAEQTEDMREQLEWLVYDGFVVDTDLDWMTHLPRFLNGVCVRLEHALHDPLEDMRRQKIVAGYWRHFMALNLDYSEILEHYRWMIEEYRVSVFAQSLGTSQTVSAKRLNRLQLEIDQMVSAL
ncbi:MAG: ATP-dependent RNA helicase HrpA [Pseudomonadota bacterium]